MSSTNKLSPLEAGKYGQSITFHSSTIVRSPSFIKRVNSSATEQTHFRKWIQENLRKKSCAYFVESEDVPKATRPVCECGYAKSQHSEEALKAGQLQGERWNATKHIQQFPTDAFGDIAFEGLGQKSGKYVRVSNDTAPVALYQLMTKYWELDPPHLLISVTGGAKNFNLKPDLRYMFLRGLMKVAQSTGAWIISGGSFTGVMKYVGEAVRLCNMTSTQKEKQIIAIGVASWGIVHNRDSLVDTHGKFPATYYVDEENQGRLSCLDYNHTHFILVDNGTQGHYGVEIPLRTQLERYISKQRMGTEDAGLEIPIVCVVLEGGPGTLSTIHGAMSNGTPCVIVEGSGRVADILATAADLPMTEITIPFIQKQLRTFFAESYNMFSEREIILWTKKIQDIIRMRELLTVFRPDTSRNNDLDVAILQALLKASTSHGHKWQENLDHQLQLAIAWNRLDIAKQHIFTDDKQWKSSHLYQAMFAALVGNKHGFVELFLEYGVNLNEFLSPRMLVRLYNNIPHHTPLYKKLRKVVDSEKHPQIGDKMETNKKVLLHHVSVLLQELLGEFMEPLYKQPSISSRKSFDMKTIRRQQDEFYEGQLDSPERDLFIWAILMKRKNMASIFWRQGMDSIAASLIACKILKKISSEENDTDLSELMEELAQEYEDQAVGLFTECYRKHAKRAQKLLVRVSASWGNTTCLRLALEAESKKFMAHGGVQDLLTKIWWGELSVETHTWQILLCLMLWPAIYSKLITFRQNDVRKKELSSNAEFSVKVESLLTRQRSLIHKEEDVKPLSCWQQLRAFYTAPVVVFYWNVLAYFGFLWLFSYVILIDFHSQPSGREYLLYAWIATLVCEELRQFLYDPDSFGFRKKALLYINSAWNLMDVAAILIFIVGLVCRLFPATFYHGRVIFALDFIIYCLRLMHIFTVSKTLGPKIIMLEMMMKDIFFFLFLLFVIIVAYGVANHAILIHNDERLNWIFHGVVYKSYLMLYGDIPTDISYSGFDLNQCSVNGTDPYQPKCAEHNSIGEPIFPEWLTILLLCLYLLFTNILLLNLLIAMFNYTFQVIQDNTDKIWKFQRYSLIEEYYTRPPAPPPFIIFSHIVVLIECATCKQSKRKHKKFKKQLDEKEEADILSWENIIKENYLVKQTRNQNQSVNEQVKCTLEKVELVAEVLDVNRESNKFEVMEQTIHHLEDQMLQSMRALNWIMNTLMNKDFSSRENAPALVISDGRIKNKEDVGEEGDLKPKYHIKARSLVYPDSNIERFPVPDEMVPWQVKFTEYNPPSYTAERPDENRLTRKTAPLADCLDSGLDGDTAIVNESLQNRVNPDHVNPVGRTGLTGKGSLHSFGCNLMMEPIITRFHRNSDNSVVVKGSKNVLELLVVQYPGEDWTLPAGILNPGQKFPKKLKLILNAKMMSMFQNLQNEALKIYRGYVDDPRNTDDAWIETEVLNFHLNEGNSLINTLTSRADSGVSREIRLPFLQQGSVQEIMAKWQVMEQGVPVCMVYKDYLQTVAGNHSAHF
ncbi:transient receptor potential cation channel subfamily M member 2 [Amblyraja radiata]|uniref:transient receptor potential cation channel subfamily M member 2 n=1 Tax=Amblyraja radiata TaxID=386614 RepID=UPI00140399A7|nr:transient receptor potential cation channel subfamily M member 2 [Amblyraja radiata]